MITHPLFQIIVIVCVLLVAWWVVQRWSPDPLVTKIAQVILFLIALWVVFFKILPLAGISL
jgi:hypothetical protein